MDYLLILSSLSIFFCINKLLLSVSLSIHCKLRYIRWRVIPTLQKTMNFCMVIAEDLPQSFQPWQEPLCASNISSTGGFSMQVILILTRHSTVIPLLTTPNTIIHFTFQRKHYPSPVSTKGLARVECGRCNRGRGDRKRLFII
jgi:hypothetical protein